jgi:hypothetical protein
MAGAVGLRRKDTLHCETIRSRHNGAGQAAIGCGEMVDSTSAPRLAECRFCRGVQARSIQVQ